MHKIYQKQMFSNMACNSLKISLTSQQLYQTKIILVIKITLLNASNRYILYCLFLITSDYYLSFGLIIYIMLIQEAFQRNKH